uniref:Uncharacterized protein n=1 Tax=Anguilla anguilla TaxID=7936 RepID=A0A0E9TSL5_ANGAN
MCRVSASAGVISQR